MSESTSRNLPPKVIVVDDDPAVRASLREMVSMMNLTVIDYGSAEQFFEGFDRAWRGCIIVDVKMPGLSGVQLQTKLLEDQIEMPVIVISGHGDIPLCVQAMKNGALDFFEKPFRPELLRDCITEALALDEKRRNWKMNREAVATRLAKLTAEERAVLDGIASFKSNKLIAQDLDICLRTVQLRRTSIMKKFGVKSASELLRFLQWKVTKSDVLA